MAWPTPRFTDNSNGTVTDNLTGLIWMKNAGALGRMTWEQALTAANSLHSGSIAGLTDGSKAGDWRLPNVKELQSLHDYGRKDPALPTGHPFTNVGPVNRYWSSTTWSANTIAAWTVTFLREDTGNGQTGVMVKDIDIPVWCVRGP